MSIDLTSVENKKLLEAIRADHPELPTYICENCVRFYRAGVIDDLDHMSHKKKRGRPPKKRVPVLPPTEHVGAVSIKQPPSNATQIISDA